MRSAMTGFAKMTLADYLAIKAINNGALSAFARSPAAYKLMMDEGPKEPTPTMVIGSAVHAATLEPEIFTATYSPLEFDGRTREGKAERERIKDENLIPLRIEEYHGVLDMARSFQTHPRIGPMLARATGIEEVAIWSVEAGLCKSRRDVIGDGWIMELKTTASLDRFVPWQFTDLGYHRQAAWYSWGDELLGRSVDQFFFAVVANSAPYESAIYRATENALRIGRSENDELLRRLMRCREMGIWPRHIVELLEADVTPAKMVEIEGVTR